MPELPEVETVRQGLNQVTLNQRIQGGEVLLTRAIAHPVFYGSPSENNFLTGLQGSAIAQWQRRGKYLLAELVQADTPTRSAGWLGVHLRMTGQLLWLTLPTPVHPHTRVRLFLAPDRELRFVDQRTFGQLWWVPPSQTPETVMAGLKRLGPEPFSPDFSTTYFCQHLQGRKRPIKNILLDQSVVAGVGNIYADEALFLSGIRPQTLGADLSSAQIERLRTAVIQVLQASIDVGGTTFSTFLNVQGINGNYGKAAWVYNRKDQPCRVCAAPIQRLRMAGRSAHFCLQCQQ